jgi:hypothetical protein
MDIDVCEEIWGRELEVSWGFMGVRSAVLHMVSV